MSHPYATAAAAQSPQPTASPHAAAPAARPHASTVSVADSRGLPSSHDGDDDGAGTHPTSSSSSRSSSRSGSCDGGTSGTIVSRSDEVSLSSSASPSASSSAYSSRSPSRPSASASAASLLSAAGVNETNSDDDNDGPKATETAPQKMDGDAAAPPHQHHRHHRHHAVRGQLHTAGHRHATHRSAPPTHADPSSPLHAMRPALSGDDPEGYMAGSETSAAGVYGGRVQTSEVTRFTHVLAPGHRGTAEAYPLTQPYLSPPSTSSAGVGDEGQRWWRPAHDSLATPNRPTERSCASSTASQPHPYRFDSPTAHDAPAFGASPSPVRQARSDGAGVADGTAGGPYAAAAAAAAAMPNPHIQRPHSTLLAAAAATASPLMSAVGSTTPLRSSTPLPPTHPRRSASAQSRPSGSPSSAAFQGVGPAIATRTAQPPNTRASPPPPPPGAAAAESPLLPPTPLAPAALRRSSSFTAGVRPAGAARVWAAAGEAEAHPYLVSAVPPATTRVPPPQSLSERVHERTSSVASSVHSGASSARPSVPLPPSHVGVPSNLMAAVWVDLPPSQPGSRCATPLRAAHPSTAASAISNSNSGEAQQHRRRRTTPRRVSEPPSPVASTLAASVASSVEGTGVATSTAAVLASVRRHYVTVSTQTEEAAEGADGSRPQDGPAAVVDGVVGAADASPSSLTATPVRTSPLQRPLYAPSAHSSDGERTPEKWMVRPTSPAKNSEAEKQATVAAAGAAAVVGAVGAIAVTAAVDGAGTAASVSSTSAEVSPRSARMSAADAAGVHPTSAESTHAVGGGTAAATAVANCPAAAAAEGETAGAVGGERSSAATSATPLAAGVMVSPKTPELAHEPAARTPPAVSDGTSQTGAVGAAQSGVDVYTRTLLVALTANGSGVAVPPPSAPAAAAPLEQPTRPVLHQGVLQPPSPAGATTTASSTLPAPTDAVEVLPVVVAAQAAELQRLRSELERVKAQYAEALGALQQMKQSGSGGGGAAPAAAEAASADSPSFPSSSSSSSSLSDADDSSLAVGASSADVNASASSDRDAAATLQRVKEALQRTRTREGV